MSLASILGFNSRNVSACIVNVAGTEISEYYQNLVNTKVTLKREGSAEAQLTFNTLRKADGNTDMEYSGFIRAWVPLEIIVVFGDEEIPLFRGHILNINTDSGDSGGVTTVTLRCQDGFAVMDRNCRQIRHEEGQTYQDIISEVLHAYPEITLGTPLPTTPVENMHQEKTDYRFIRQLAEHGYYEWFLREEGSETKLYFRTPLETTSADSNKKIMVRSGRQTNCLSFNVSYDGYQPDRVRFSTAPLSNSEITQSVTHPSMEVLGNQSTDSSGEGHDLFEWCLPPADGNNEERANERAQGAVTENSFKLKAEGKLDGTVYGNLLVPGTVVQVGGVGANSGKWYVDTTNHEFDANGYFVDFHLIRNAATGMEESSEEHILAGIL